MDAAAGAIHGGKEKMKKLFDSKYRAGIAVALNADGTPVTKEQLEAWRGDNEHID